MKLMVHFQCEFVVSEENVLRNCEVGETELSMNSGPILISTPGYPNEYKVSQDCASKITINSGILNVEISIEDRQSPGLNAYLCETLPMVLIHIQPGTRSCSRFSDTASYAQVNSFTFHFHSSTNPIRGILFEVTSGEIDIVLHIPA